MGLDFAIDELYASGWSELDSAGCEFHADGRLFPRLERVKDEFSGAGKQLTVRHVELFNCYRAEWRDAEGSICGAVVGHSANEAAVYALSQLRRSLVGA
ncbi:MAG: hypothetical protein KDA05_07545 [Phycisphaerales bacterium]|nr:hypothetical protein [Phycisphaerales bacterium]MCB9840800.1 hypothetical protein [Phycisphaeraceae bacterium]